MKPTATVWVHPFGVEVPIFEDDKKIVRYHKKKWGIEGGWNLPAYGLASREYDADGQARFALLIPESANLGLIVHECSHIVDLVMDECGVPINVENTEIRAYMLATLFCDVCHVLKRDYE
ncbi:hypothetical protein [uncultured Ruegeria sp.]|uniref:hypothetical protein n=1 Tax=uncultured Ruegeria sp. TaxID=259304 RepID=UPI002629D72E|nr:hypothetical protein [uncultured Ruegeria sp.]